MAVLEQQMLVAMPLVVDDTGLISADSKQQRPVGS